MMLLLVMLLFKSLLVCAAAGLLLPALRRSSAAARHLVCLGALAALLALPLFSLALPGWHLPVLQTQEPTPVRSSPTLPKREGAEVKTQRAEALLATPTDSTGPVNTAAPSETLRLHASGGPLRGEERASMEVGFLYLLGLLLASTRPLLGLWGINRLSRVCVAVADEPTLTAAGDCAGLLGLPAPRLCRADVPVPMTWGWRRPVVVLPDSAAEWPADRLRSVLLHELAHVRRCDWPGHRLADLACAVYWFHPLVWMTARRLRTESEAACDDLVLASGIPAPDYARHLLEIASALPRTSRRSSAAIAMAQTSQIESRLSMILDKTRTRRTVARRVLLAALIPGTAALVTLAVLRPDAKAQAAPSLSPAVPATTVASGGVSVVLPNGGSPLSFRFSRGTSMMVGRDARHTSFITSPDLTANGTTLFAGATDSTGLGGRWWSASGKVLPQPIFNSAAAYEHQSATTSPGQRSLLFAFRLPPNAHDVTANLMTTDGTSSSSNGTWPGKMQGQADYTEASLNPDTGGVRVLSASYPATKAKGGLRVGLAFGAWKLAASDVLAPHKTTDVTGSFIFSPPAETAKGVLMVISTNSTDDIRLVAVDAQGRELLPTTIGGESINKLDQFTAQFDLPLSQIKAFRVQTRPFQWIEFKDVALKPVQSAGKA